jgi:hypothetical protein
VAAAAAGDDADFALNRGVGPHDDVGVVMDLIKSACAAAMRNSLTTFSALLISFFISTYPFDFDALYCLRIINNTPAMMLPIMGPTTES